MIEYEYDCKLIVYSRPFGLVFNECLYCEYLINSRQTDGCDPTKSLMELTFHW